MIRILYLIGQLGLGGSERQLTLLLKHMNKTRFEPYVVVFNPSPNVTLNDDLHRAGVTVYEMPVNRKNVLLRIAWLVDLAHQIHPHIIHSWTLHDNAYAAIVGWLAGIPKRLGSLRGALASPGFMGASTLARWLILHGVQVHVVNAVSCINELRSVGVSAENIYFLPNAVEIPPMYTRMVGIRRVGMVGNLRREKNYPLFLNGLAQVLPEFSEVQGVMVGQPVLPYDTETPVLIQAEIARLGLEDRLIQSGFCANVPDILREWDVFCLTSDSEGSPNVILEAMAASLPVIATRVGGIPQMVDHGLTGLLIPLGDVDALVTALRELLSDPAKAHAMGLAGRARVEREFSPQVILPRFESFYTRVLNA